MNLGQTITLFTCLVSPLLFGMTEAELPTESQAIKQYQVPPATIYCFNQKGVAMVRKPIEQARWLDAAKKGWSSWSLTADDQKFEVVGPDPVEGLVVEPNLSGLWQLVGNDKVYFIAPDGRCWVRWQPEQAWEFFGIFRSHGLYYHPSFTFATGGVFSLGRGSQMVYSESNFSSVPMNRIVSDVAIVKSN